MVSPHISDWQIPLEGSPYWVFLRSLGDSGDSYSQVSTIDESVGKLVETLKANNLYDNTLIGEILFAISSLCIAFYHES